VKSEKWMKRCQRKSRRAFCRFQLLLFLVAFQLAGMASPGLCADKPKSTPLKGEVRTGRSEFIPGNERTKREDPFLDESVSGPGSGTATDRGVVETRTKLPNANAAGSSANAGAASVSAASAKAASARAASARAASVSAARARAESARAASVSAATARPESARAASARAASARAASARAASARAASARAASARAGSARAASVSAARARPESARAASVSAASGRAAGASAASAKAASARGAGARAVANSDINFLKGAEAEQRNDNASALENYVIALNNDPSNPDFIAAVRRVEMKFKRRYPAFHAYTSYFTGKHDERLLLNYGVRLYSLSCFQQAENLFTKAVSLDPSNPNGYFNLGVIYEHKGQLANALTNYQKSLELFKLQGNDLVMSVQQQAQIARERKRNNPTFKLSHERRRYSGMEDPKNGRELAQVAVNSVLRQMKGMPSDIPKWPMLDVTQRPGTKSATTRGTASRHVDTCDHCLILRNVEMWPN